MAKRKDKREKEKRFAAVTKAAMQAKATDAPPRQGHQDAPLSDDVIAASAPLAALAASAHTGELTKMKKFRFQLLHRWIVTRVAPCRVADVAGGKGLLAYLLQQDGWSATVIDPFKQTLPAKYKDLASGKQVKLTEKDWVPRLSSEFQPEMAAHFDLLVAMHAHGCNIQLVDAALEYGCDLILLPCCVIHEPILPPPGVHWIQWLVEYVIGKGFAVEPFRLNFKGQNIGIYARQGSGAGI